MNCQLFLQLLTLFSPCIEPLNWQIILMTPCLKFENSKRGKRKKLHLCEIVIIIRPNFCCCYVALSRPTVKCEKTGSVFFFFFFFFLCQIWAKNLLKFVFNGLKKHLYMRFDCIPPEFSPFRNLKKILENSTLSRYVKKKKKKSTDRRNFQILVGWGKHNNFFFLA